MELLDIPGIGEKTKTILESNGITTPKQLLDYYPRTHRRYTRTNTQDAEIGAWVVLTGTLTPPKNRHTGRLSTQLSTFTDQSGKLTLRWFNSPFVTRSVRAHALYSVLGRIESYANQKHIINPILKLVNPQKEHPQQLYLPIYTPIGSLKSGNIRKLIKSALKVVKLSDPLTADILAQNHLFSLNQAVKSLHFPHSQSELDQAVHRLGFDELVSLQYDAITLKESISLPTEAINGDHHQLQTWISTLPYTPTDSQLSAISAITHDVSQPRAMHRLVIGDVGSGKTWVAAGAILFTHTGGKKTLLLAPTQILAEQLYNSLQDLLGSQLSISLFTSAHKGSLKADLVVGTHALLNPKYAFHNVGLVIIDEQHRFGVKDREALRILSPTPHLLMLSATPIPRTLSMTTLAHLDVTSMSQMPKNRLPVKSYVVTSEKRTAAYNWINSQITQNNERAFIITPLIEQAQNEEESPKVALLALQKELTLKFPQLTIDYVHGRMKETEKTQHLTNFRQGKTHLLVATSMVEVGIDIPEANIIAIENAEQFGLATLHQLRGRVGRGGGQGHCLLFTNKKDKKTHSRLSYFVRETSGADIAAYDLERRGPGDIFGTIQSGNLGLRFASLSDPALLQATHKIALSLAK